MENWIFFYRNNPLQYYVMLLYRLLLSLLVATWDIGTRLPCSQFIRQNICWDGFQLTFYNNKIDREGVASTLEWQIPLRTLKQKVVLKGPWLIPSGYQGLILIGTLDIISLLFLLIDAKVLIKVLKMLLTGHQNQFSPWLLITTAISDLLCLFQALHSRI